MKYLGPDGTPREMNDHLAYLERCAKHWEEAGKASSPTDSKAAHEEAARVRAMAALFLHSRMNVARRVAARRVAYATRGMTRNALYILSSIATGHFGGPSSTREQAALDRAINRGWIERHGDPRNWIATRGYTLTDEGARALAAEHLGSPS